MCADGAKTNRIVSCSASDAFSPARAEEIGPLIDLHRPSYHFFGHYDQARVSQTANGVTRQEKLADVNWDRHDRGCALDPNSMGLPRWHSREQQSFEAINAPWFQEQTRT